MTIPSRSAQSDNWNEYKRLVLAELERLNDCVEKLRERQDSTILNWDKDASDKISSIAQTLTDRIKEADLEVQVNVDKDIEVIKNRLNKLEQELNKNDLSEFRKSRLAFWTAVVTILGSLIASVISLVIALT